MNSSIIRIGAVFAMLSVILGAFGAHAIKDSVDVHSLEIWNKAVSYQFIHAIALMLCGMLCIGYIERNIKRSAVFFTLGIILFSGSLYILTFRNQISVNVNWIGPLTPLGGISFIIGWILLFVATGKKKVREKINE